MKRSLYWAIHDNDLNEDSGSNNGEWVGRIRKTAGR